MCKLKLNVTDLQMKSRFKGTTRRRRRRHPSRDFKNERHFKVTRICKSVHKGNVLESNRLAKLNQERDVVNLQNHTERREQVLPKPATESALSTEAFNVDYNESIRSIVNETSRNHTSQEQYYGKRIAFIVLLSTASTILLFAIMFAICKRTSWSRVSRLHKPLYDQTTEGEGSFRRCCACIDESDEDEDNDSDGVSTSDWPSESATRCLKCWRGNKCNETTGNVEKTPLINARRKRRRKKRIKKRRKEIKTQVQSSDETLSNEEDLSGKRQRQTAGRLSQRNKLLGKINQCVYRKNDPNCQCWKCREYVSMFNVWSTRGRLHDYYSSDLDRLTSYNDTEDSCDSHGVFKSCPCARKTYQPKDPRAGEKVCVHEMTDKK